METLRDDIEHLLDALRQLPYAIPAPISGQIIALHADEYIRHSIIIESGRSGGGRKRRLDIWQKLLTQ